MYIITATYVILCHRRTRRWINPKNTWIKHQLYYCNHRCVRVLTLPYSYFKQIPLDGFISSLHPSFFPKKITKRTPGFSFGMTGLATASCSALDSQHFPACHGPQATGFICRGSQQLLPIGAEPSKKLRVDEVEDG